MYRDRAQLLTSQVHNFVLNHGALGDIITSLPAIIQARRAAPSMTLKVWVPGWQLDFHRHLLAPYGEFDVRDLAEFPLKKAERVELDVGPMSLNAAIKNTHTRNRVHMVDYAFGCLTDSRPESMHQRSYPTLAPLGRYGSAAVPSGKYVVFPVGATSDNKLFRASVMVPILQWCVENGYKPVLVGTKESRTNAQTADGKLEKIVIRDQADMIPNTLLFECLDLREKTTLLELRDICGYADAVVGVDGGTLHVAGTTDVPIVYASGTTLPKHRYIARGGDPSYKIRYVGPRDLECAGCQSNWILTSWDFRFCAYGDNACMEKLHHEDFIAGLVELGL
jgi:ADP-heptose:LPS heptosyltransferase